MPRVPGGFGINSSIGVRRPSRAVSLADARNPEAGNVDEGLGLSSTAPGGALQPWDYRPPSDGMNPFQALEWLGREGIREPLSTALTYASLAEGAGDTGLGGWFDRDRWGQAHGIAQDRSVGQALALAILSSKDDDITDPAWLAEAQGTGAYKRGSLGTDLAFRVFADPFGVLGGQTMRALIHRGAPAAAGAVTGAAAKGRFGLQNPERFIGRVDPPDAGGASLSLGGRAGVPSRHPAFDTDTYVAAIRGGRESVPTARGTERVASDLRRSREARWSNAIQGRTPILEDGYVVPMVREPASGLGKIPAHGVLVRLDEAGQVVGRPIRSAGDKTQLGGYNHLFGDRRLTRTKERAGWWWLHEPPAGRVTPAQSVHGPDLSRGGIHKVALTADEVASSKVDDLLERFDSILPDDEWLQTPVATRMEGGVFAGTAAEGRTLPEIGRMLGAADELAEARGARWESYTPDEIRGLERMTISREEMDAIWPTVARSYADEAVDNILRFRDDGDTIRLRELFEYPGLDHADDPARAVTEFVSRAFPSGDSGLDGWQYASGFRADAGAQRIRDVQELIVADLRAITRKWVDEADLPERVSVTRAQRPGALIGPSATTDPLRFREGHFPGMGGIEDVGWFEVALDPRKDIDWFMNARRGHNFYEEEVLVHPATLLENTVGGLERISPRTRREMGSGTAMTAGLPARYHSAPTDMPGLTPGQLQYGPDSPSWLPEVVRQLEKGSDIPTAPSEILAIPVRKAAAKARTAINIRHRDRLLGRGWGDLPTAHYEEGVRVSDEWQRLVEKIYSSNYDASDWYRWYDDILGPTPPGATVLGEATEDVHTLIRHLQSTGKTSSGRPIISTPDSAQAVREFKNTLKGRIGELLEWETWPGEKGKQLYLKGDWEDELWRIVEDHLSEHFPRYRERMDELSSAFSRSPYVSQMLPPPPPQSPLSHMPPLAPFTDAAGGLTGSPMLPPGTEISI